MGTVIAFDLDMTLVDSARSITESLAHACRNLEVEPDSALLHATLGMPLEQVLRTLLADKFGDHVPAAVLDLAAADYRRYYHEHAFGHHTLLPGVAEFFLDLLSTSQIIAVISAKQSGVMASVLSHVGLDAHYLIGERFGHTKGEALLRLQEIGPVLAYVGDHAGDMLGARAAKVPAIGVLTGPHTERELVAAGADLVFETMHGVHQWWRQLRLSSAG